MIRLLLALAIALLLAGCRGGGEGEPGAGREIAVGEVVEGSTVQRGPSAGIEVRLPSGPAYFEVDDDLTAVPQDELPGEFEDAPAAAGARVVHVAWRRELLGYGSDVMRVMTGSDVDDTGQQVGLTVVAGGQRIEVPDVGLLSGIGDPDHVYVGVPDDAADLRLEVTYDGVTQTVDPTTGGVEHGRAEGLYDVPLAAEHELGAGRGSCPVPDREQGLDTSYGCGVLDSWQLPYVDGLGWAGEGQAWLVADVSSTLGAVHWIAGDEATSYRTRLRSWQVLADGSRPVAALPRRLGNTAQDKRLAFAVAPRESHRIEVRASYAARASAELVPGAPARPVVRIARAFRVPQPDQ